MKKLIFTLLCTLILLTPCLCSANTYTDIPEDSNEEKVLDIIYNLGIMVGYEDDDGVRTFKPEQPITRAEFVSTIYNAVGDWGSLSGGGANGGFDWNSFFYGKGADDRVLLIPASADGVETVRTSLWLDVEEDFWAYDYMKTVATFGYIVGYPDLTFRPDNTITYNEAITILLNMAGYKEYALARGGFPDGYISLANRFSLSKGLYATGSEPLTRIDAARLIYNAFDMEMAPNEVDSNDEDRTFLNDVVGVYILEGTLSYTDITSLYSNQSMKEYEAKIAETEFSFDKSDIEIREYIGQHIRAYLKETEENSGEYTLISYETTGKDEITVIDADCFEDFSDNVIYYTKDVDSDTVKKEKLRSNPICIYNGKYKSPFGVDDFKNINKGTITVIEKSDLDFDIIIVEDFRSGYTNSVNKVEMEIYDKLITDVGAASIKLTSDTENEKIIYQLLDTSGDGITIDDLAEGAINYYINDGFVKVIYSENKVSGRITKKIDDEEVYYAVDGEMYKISAAYQNYLSNSIRTNFDGSVVLDRYNEVVWVTDEVSISGYAYIIVPERGVRYDSENEQLLLTYYDIEKGEVKEGVATASDVVFYDSDGQKKDYDIPKIRERLNENKYIVKLSLNDENMIKRIRLPLDATGDKIDSYDKSSNDIKLVLETNESSTSEYYKDNYKWTGNSLGHSACFGAKVYLDANSIAVRIPIDESEYTSYAKLSYKNITANTGYVMEVYSFNPESPYAKIAVLHANSSTKTALDAGNSLPFYLVTKVSESINDEGELGTEVVLFDGTNTVTVFAKEDEDNDNKSLFDEPMNAFSFASKDSKVERGDFIHIGLDEITDEVIAVRKVYDANAVNPAWCGVDPDDDATVCKQNHTHTSVLGHFPGTTGYCIRGDVSSNSNPIYYNSDVVGGGGYYGIQYGDFFQLGYVYQVNEGLYEMTTQCLNGYSGEKDTDHYSWSTIDIAVRNPKVYIVNDDYSVTNGTLSNIKSYKQEGDKASKCIFHCLNNQFSIWVLP